ncbi:MAG: hypothetical protein ACLTGI_11485 [Hoylesella buccalis]
MKKNTILLLAGAVITLLFIIFATSLFESLFYEREFSNEMYSANLYFIVAIVTALIAWAFAGIYYYVINSVSFSRWYHWLIVLIGAMIVRSCHQLHLSQWCVFRQMDSISARSSSVSVWLMLR